MQFTKPKSTAYMEALSGKVKRISILSNLKKNNLSHLGFYLFKIHVSEQSSSQSRDTTYTNVSLLLE